MSDIPYSVRDKSTRVNAIKGFNFDTLSNHELFKKQDSNNITGTRVFNIKSGTSNTQRGRTDCTGGFANGFVVQRYRRRQGRHFWKQNRTSVSCKLQRCRCIHCCCYQ